MSSTDSGETAKDDSGDTSRKSKTPGDEAKTNGGSGGGAKKAKANIVTYSKDDDLVDVNVSKVDKENILQIVDLSGGRSQADLSLKHKELIVPKTAEKLSIQPRHVRDFEIVKPNEKEPNIFKALTSKLTVFKSKDTKEKKDKDDKADKISQCSATSKAS